MLLRLMSSERFSKSPFLSYLWEVSNTFIHIYSNIVPYFLPPSNPPTPLPVQFMLKKVHVLFSSFWVILLLISLPSYFRPMPTVSCEKEKRLHRSARIQRLLRKWAGMFSCSSIYFITLPTPSSRGRKGWDLRANNMGRGIIW